MVSCQKECVIGAFSRLNSPFIADKSEALMKISVVVPTCNRPRMLRSALRSIQDQSRPDLIAEIIVSENSVGGALVPETEAACRECGELPVTYHRQPSQLRIVDHFRWIVAQAKGDWVAWLADDDMWGRHHLEEAARLLEKNPAAVAYIGESVLMINDSRSITAGFRETLHSFLEENATTYKDSSVWGMEEMMVECLPQTPLNMWAMVARKPVLAEAVESLVPSNVGYESDRIFLWRVATQGQIVVGKEITTFFRTHDDNAFLRMWKQDRAEQERMTRVYIRQIIHEAEEHGIPARETWMKVWQRLDDASKRRIIKKVGKESMDEIRQLWGDEAVAVTEEGGQPKPGRAGLLKPFVPPLLWSAATKMLKGNKNGKQA